MSARELESILAAAIAPEASAPAASGSGVDGVVLGQIVGFRDNGATPLVVHPRQSGTAAVAARTVVDLSGEHVGQEVVLLFEDGDPLRPIVMGYVRGEKNWRLPEQPGQVEVEADGERLVISAKEQVVLRCGKASITLTKAGKVMIQGNYVVSRSSGVNRIKGGSVQIN
jgi:hypothetical protein